VLCSLFLWAINAVLRQRLGDGEQLLSLAAGCRRCDLAARPPRFGGRWSRVDPPPLPRGFGLGLALASVLELAG